MTFVIKEIGHINNSSSLARVIYRNFVYLADFPQLEHTQQDIENLLNSPNFVGWYVYDDTKIIAYLTGEKKHLQDGRYAYYITYIFVATQFRSHKIGTKLMDNLETYCRNLGIRWVLLTCDIQDSQVVKFYDRRGYKRDYLLKNNTRHEVFSLDLLD